MQPKVVYPSFTQPIAFFSKALRDAPLKYNIREKQALALVKAIKDFRVYILYSDIISHVPNAVVKDIEEAVKLAKFLSKFKPPVSKLYTTVFPASDSTLYAATSFTDSVVSSP